MNYVIVEMLQAYRGLMHKTFDALPDTEIQTSGYTSGSTSWTILLWTKHSVDDIQKIAWNLNNGSRANVRIPDDSEFEEEVTREDFPMMTQSEFNKMMRETE